MSHLLALAHLPRKEAHVVEKEVVRTDRAPGPFQGAPYNQAIRVGDLVFVAGQLGVSLETGQLAGAGVSEQTEQIMRNLSAILEAAGSGLERACSCRRCGAAASSRSGRRTATRPIAAPAAPR